jgi:hypothetical protein
MAFNTQEQEIIKWGLANGKSKEDVTQALTNFRTGIVPQKKEVVATEPSFLENLKTDILNRADKVGAIQARPETSILEKGVQTFGQGAGAAANVIEKTVEEIPGVKQAFGAIGSGINWLATSDLSPIKKLGGVIGESKALQEAVKLYDTDPNFKDSVDAVANIARLGGDVQMAADAVNLTKNFTSKIKTKIEPTVAGVKTSLENAGNATKQISGEVIPTADRIINEEVTKALQLNAADVRNIEASTGNVVGRFMADNNLIGNNLIDTQKLVKNFFDTNYSSVRSEIEKVATKYKPTEIPRYKQALTELKSQIEGVAGQENKLSEIDTLLKKKTVLLNNVQRVKELVDDTYNLYKVTGDVKEGVAKQGFAQIRSEMKNFIEKEVKTNTGADISDLNNKVSTSKSILNASEARSTSGLTKSNFKVGDLAIFGAGSMMGSPLFGAALLVGKKIIESPAIRFRVAKWLDTLSDARKLKIQEELSQGKVPVELKKVVQSSEPKIENIKANTLTTKVIPKSTIKIPNKQGGFIDLQAIAKSIDEFDRNAMQAFIDKVNQGLKPSKEVMAKAQAVADAMKLESSTGTNRKLANDFNAILEFERNILKKKMK